VPELWRYAGASFEIFHLHSGQYVLAHRSRALPLLTGEVLAQF
jgi:hypothetical protein